MGVKKVLPTFKMFDNEVITDGSIATSESTYIGNLDNISIQFELQNVNTYNTITRYEVLVSNDNINFYPLSITYPDFSTLDYNLIININQLSQPWIQVKFYNATGGSVDLSVTIFGKDLN